MICPDQQLQVLQGFSSFRQNNDSVLVTGPGYRRKPVRRKSDGIYFVNRFTYVIETRSLSQQKAVDLRTYYRHRGQVRPGCLAAPSHRRRCEETSWSCWRSGLHLIRHKNIHFSTWIYKSSSQARHNNMMHNISHIKTDSPTSFTKNC